MKKLFAIGTLLLSSVAVFASPAAAYDRNVYVKDVRVVHVDRDRDGLRAREERLARERRERELRQVRYEHSRWDRY
jgi:hypothetical protein